MDINGKWKYKNNYITLLTSITEKRQFIKAMRREKIKLNM
jgi:hypothetical protein